jgi:pimeloyl-ACP methyl ester carboxylesterase
VTATCIGVADDRQIAFAEFGAPDGDPVFFLHGGMASWRYRHPDDSIAAGLGIRLITVARPGFGESTRHRGRTVASFADDVAAAADALHLDRFAVVGHSAGGSHALACGAVLPDRVRAVAAAGSLAPFSREERFTSLGATAQVVFRAALQDVDTLERGLEPLATVFTTDVEHAVRASFAAEGMPDDPALVELFAADLRDVFAQGVAGWADDLHALVHDWDFLLADVVPPVDLWYGHDDPLRTAHGDALARVLEVPVRVHDGGHLAFFEVWADVLRSVTGD